MGGQVRLDKHDRERVSEIAHELKTVRLHAPSSIASILPALRELTEFESIGTYSVRNRTGRWEIERYDAVGMMREAEPLVRRLFATVDEFPLYYNPITPSKAQRNRVIDARAWIEQSCPGTWENSAVCTRVLRPFNAQHHSQPRALLCNGASLLGWFGGIDPRAPTPRQIYILSLLIEPMRWRLDAEQRLREGAYLRVTLDAAFARIGAPAFVVTGDGVVREANPAGQDLLARNPSAVMAELREVVATRASNDRVELLPIHDGHQNMWIAIASVPSTDARVTACIEACKRKWALTRRQQEVLALVARGRSNASIAAELECVERTIELHVTALLDRAGVNSRSALVAKLFTAVC